MSQLGFEAHERTVKRHAELSALDEGPQVVPLGEVVEQLPMVKDETEIALLAQACAITCEAFADTVRAIPHHSPGPRTWAVGDLITIDCGARYGGYHADMARTVALGEPAGWQREGRRRCSQRPQRNC